MLTSTFEEGSTPSPRYHHASSLLTSHESGQGASHSFMLVVGGVTQNGVAMDTWSLNLSSLIWREHTVRIRFVMEILNIIKSELYFCTGGNKLIPPSMTELSAASSGGPHSHCAPRFFCAADWWLLSREWIQPPSVGVQPSFWKLDHCPSHWHTSYRFLLFFVDFLGL